MRTILALVLVVGLASCGPAAVTPSTPSPSAATTATSSASSAPTSAPPTASPTPAASTRAGGSPTPIAFPTNTFLAAAGNGVVWALVASSRLFRSTDRGDTWTERTVPSGVHLGDIAFVNDRDGWLLSAGSPGTTTVAGGSLRAGPVSDFVAVMFVDATGFQSGRQIEYIYRSTDRGAIWSYVTTAAQSMPVVFVTTTRWIQIFLPELSSETTDAGRTWHAYATDYGQAAPVAPQVVFGDANTGYASVRGSIQRTTDGGAHWMYIKTPGTQQ